jgi:hypothetical protein
MRRPNSDAFARWERAYARDEPVDYAQNVRVYAAIYEHARALGPLERADPLEGLEHKIRLARLLNADVPPPDDTA